MNQNKERMHALDGLRGFAAFFVLLHHLVISNASIAMTKQGHDAIGRLLSSIGASGVELFFCLSAVVLLRPHLRAGRPFKASEYVKRRATRLLPPFLAAWAPFLLFLMIGEAVLLRTEE